ncbi:MAG: translation elongation factor Ts [Steroidobacteraceae bacterium]|nr:translation elongation factor Ts [Steroidobacteraceae bacterium]
MNISADAVKQLRERTGAGMMECKKALVEANGDLEAAAEAMRKSGLAKADKKASRVAAEGTIVAELAADGRSGVLVEVNCETDFVARQDDFQAFAKDVAKAALASGATDVEPLLAQTGPDGVTFEERRRALIAKIGENIGVRRLARVTAPDVLGSYLHGTRIGALVALKGGDAALAKDLAMHVAAINPAYLDANAVPQAELAKEREIQAAKAATEATGKPAEVVAKMVEGRIRKYLAEITLVGQPFVKDDTVTVEKLLKKADASVAGFVRLEVGAGIEKKQENFAEEVMAQVKGAEKR